MKSILLALLSFACALTGAAQSPPAQFASRTALIIGISSYSKPEISSLPGVAADMKSALAIAKAMGIPDKNIVTLRDAAATKDGILEALRQLGESTSDGARTFVYFSGHGTRWLDPQAGGCLEGLLSYDYQVITNTEIAAITKKLSAKADKFLALIDACHSAGVAPQVSLSRALGFREATPKFYSKALAPGQSCEPTNLKRSLLSETVRLGALPENFVQITSSLSAPIEY